MSKGRYTPLRHVRLMLVRQGGLCAAPGCKAELILGPRGRRVNFIVEHCRALGRGGKNTLKNKELRCLPHADDKTHHPRSRATTIGGDNYEIKKTTRMRRKARHRVSHGRKPQSKWPQGRKLRGRGFAPQCKPLRSR